ncbi:MAG: hypothetical protein ACRDB0_03575 [Paraclostridium sp.]
MSSKFEIGLNDIKKFNSTYSYIEKESNTQQDEPIDVEDVDTRDIQDKSNEQEIEILKEKIITNDKHKKSIIGKGQIYKSKDIFIEAPHKDIVIGIDDIERDIYVEGVEIANGIASLIVVISETITYSTCDKNSIENIYNENDSIINKDLCIDGVVRSNTSIIPYKMIIDVPGAKDGDTYSIEESYIDGVTSKYILKNGDIVDSNMPFDDYIIGLQEGYIISVKIKIL